jgi:hypothetical protein
MTEDNESFFYPLIVILGVLLFTVFIYLIFSFAVWNFNNS